jgi:hypothetical protein
MKNYLIYPKSHDPKKQVVIYQSVYVDKDADLLELEKAWNICDLTGKAVDLEPLKKEKVKKS